MREKRNLTLPIIGNVQHGEKIISNGKTRVKEHGYFIAKIKDENMQPYLDKFNELIKGQKSLDIQFLDDNPFTKKRVRYNQGGLACYCIDNEDTGRIKEKNLWKPISCNSNCDYLKKDANGKTPCNRVGWLKFFIPAISTDRIWLMKITGQQSIDNLDVYLQIQKMQGTLINKIFTVFLTQKEQTNYLGKTFNNYVLDILKKDDFISNNQIQQTNQKQDDLSTNNTQNVNNNVVKQEENVITPKNADTSTQTQNNIPKEKTTKKTSDTKGSTKKTTKNKTQKVEETLPEAKTETQNDNLDNCYGLIKTFNETLVNKKGEPKDYLVGEFVNMEDQIFNIVIRPEYADELLQCDLGTFVKLDVKDIGGKKFAMDLKFIEKRLKNIAA